MRLHWLLVCALALSVAGCPRRAPGPPEAAPEAALHPDAAVDLCPTDLDGVTVIAVDTYGGVALVFTGPTEEVMEIRRRTRAMASLYIHHTASVQHRIGPRPFMRRRPSPPPEQPRILAELVAADALPVDIPGGARLELRAVDEREVKALRRQEHRHAEQMNEGECPIAALAPLIGGGY